MMTVDDFICEELKYICKNLRFRSISTSSRILQCSLELIDSKEYRQKSRIFFPNGSLKDTFCCIVDNLRDGRIHRLFPGLSMQTDDRLQNLVFEIIIPFWEAMLKKIIRDNVQEDAQIEVRQVFLSEMESKCKQNNDRTVNSYFRNECLKICRDSTVKDPVDLRKKCAKIKNSNGIVVLWSVATIAVGCGVIYALRSRN